MKHSLKLSATPFRGKSLLLIAAAILLGSRTFAAIPSPEKLLPDDTLVMVTIPDCAKAREIYSSSPQTQLWSDPAMKPIKDHFLTKLKDEIVGPLERELNIRMDDYTSLPQGQFTLALTQNGWKTTAGQSPAFLMLLDTKDKSSQLKTNLANLKRKWVDSGNSIRTEKIRDIEFSILPLSEKNIPESLAKFLPDSQAEESDAETNNSPRAELVFGQYESLLILGNSTKAVEKVAVRLTGGSMPSLGDLAAYESCRAVMFRDAPFYGWANVKSFIDLLVRKSNKEEDGENPITAMFSMEKIVAATGLGGLKTIAFNLQASSEGVSAQLSIGVPESARQGLFKLFPAAGKESSPPPFVPADAVKFQRCRIDGQKAWATLQTMLGEISPQMSGSLDFVLNTANEAARQKDPNFDVKKNIFGNLGDDIISYEKAPKGAALADLTSPPSLFLIGSPHPEQLAASLKAILVFINREGSPTEREFLGRKIYSMPTPAAPGSADASGKAPARTLNYAASGSYVAITTDIAMLEEYLRSADGQQKSLRETAGLTEASAKVGGTSTGWFGYENPSETTRTAFDILRKQTANDNDTNTVAPGFPAFTPDNPFKDWVDFSLLPPFDQIAKYFSFSVYSGVANVDGLTFKIFSPVPTGLKVKK